MYEINRSFTSSSRFIIILLHFFGSATLSGRILLVGIFENNKTYAYFSVDWVK